MRKYFLSFYQRSPGVEIVLNPGWYIPLKQKINAHGNSESDQVRMVVGRWAKAVRDGNMEGLLAQHARDVVMFDVPMPLQNKGIDAYRKTWELFFSTAREDRARLIWWI